MRFLLSLIILHAITGASWAQDGAPGEAIARFEGLPGRAADESKTDVERLRALPRPSEQNDLNTFDLASAHRERATSMQEKTDGLWQSWLVSVCEGCGSDRRPFTDRDGDAYLQKLRSRQAQGRPPESRRSPEKGRYTYYAPAGAQAPERSIMAGDLSNEAIDQIRRDPNR